MICSSIDRVILAALGGVSVCGAISACTATTTDSPEAAGAANNSTSGNGSGSGSGIGGAGTLPGAGSGTVAGTGASSATGGVGAIVPLCTKKITMQSPTIATFETYDGTTAPADFSWPFGGATDGTAGVLSSIYSYGDGSATPLLSLKAGHAGNWGINLSVTNATVWGEGFGLYLMDAQYQAACIDASMYKGVTMWVRGSVPTGTFSFNVAMAQSLMPSTTLPGGSCTGTDETSCKPPSASGLPVSMTWGQVSVLWADLLGGLSGPGVPLVANGDNITSFSFGANLAYEPESEGSEVIVPVPSDIIIEVDDMAFIP